MKLLTFVIICQAVCLAQLSETHTSLECAKIDSAGHITGGVACGTTDQPLAYPPPTKKVALSAQEQAELTGLQAAADQIEKLLEQAFEALDASKKRIAEEHSTVKCPPETETETCEYSFGFEDDYSALAIDPPVKLKRVKVDANVPMETNTTASNATSTMIVGRTSEITSSGTGTIAYSPIPQTDPPLTGLWIEYTPRAPAVAPCAGSSQ